jgi:hypothetical protein
MGAFYAQIRVILVASAETSLFKVRLFKGVARRPRTSLSR